MWRKKYLLQQKFHTFWQICQWELNFEFNFFYFLTFVSVTQLPLKSKKIKSKLNLNLEKYYLTCTTRMFNEIRDRHIQPPTTLLNHLLLLPSAPPTSNSICPYIQPSTKLIHIINILNVLNNSFIQFIVIDFFCFFFSFYILLILVSFKKYQKIKKRKLKIQKQLCAKNLSKSKKTHSFHCHCFDKL